MMIYTMNIQDKPFKTIKSKKKVIEMRLNDERRKSIKEGDYIVFDNNNTHERIIVKVKGTKSFKTFKELYEAYDKKLLGYLENEVADYHDMGIYYNDELILKYGVLAIEIKYLDELSLEILDTYNDDILKLRESVFIKEQGFLTDKDEIDDHCIFINLIKNKELIATIRVFEVDSNTFGFGRFCLKKEYRGLGYGAIILKLAEQYAEDHGAHKVYISAITYAYDFYLRYGYLPTSGPYYIDTLKHVDMIKEL